MMNSTFPKKSSTNKNAYEIYRFIGVIICMTLRGHIFSLPSLIIHAQYKNYPLSIINYPLEKICPDLTNYLTY